MSQFFLAILLMAQSVSSAPGPSMTCGPGARTLQVKCEMRNVYPLEVEWRRYRGERPDYVDATGQVAYLGLGEEWQTIEATIRSGREELVRLSVLGRVHAGTPQFGQK